MKRGTACLLMMMGAFARGSWAQTAAPDAPEANPGRPTVANPATLTPVGYLQFETGVLGSGKSPELSSSFSVNGVIKISIAPRLELVASTTPIEHFRAEGKTGTSVSDVTAGAQVLLWRGERSKPTLAAAYFHRAYDGGAPDLDTGSARNSAVLLASADVKGFHYDANAIFNEQVNGGVRRGQFGQTISISHALAGKFSLGGELWHFTQPFVRGHAAGNLWDVGYAARKNLVFDAGFNVGLTGTSTPWEVFAGFTYLLPHKLW